jgi:predicted ArsR family transcriptional regulator|tara:strand:+ start:3777 stop:4439 length:663 start_codon:yes stop_codon:yes gene_type:complete
MNHHSQLSQNDRAMISVLRGSNFMSICELTDAMRVTATAVRQRLNRLMALELVERSRTVEGRGRPSYRYLLTDKGKRSGANNLDDLAVVLWEQVQAIEDPKVKQKVISGVVERLSEKYELAVRGDTVQERTRSLVEMFAERQIPISFDENAGLTVIKVDGCPYPTLASENREICDMEKALLANVIGSPVDRCQCRQDGDSCCTFEVGQDLADLEHEVGLS